MCVGNQRDSSVSRDQRGEQLDRARVDPNAAGCQQDVFEVVRVPVGHVVVELAAPLVQRVELRLVLGKRPAAAGAAFPGGLRIDFEQDRERPVTEPVPDRRGL